MKLSVLTNLFANLTLDEALAKFEKLGVEAVEIGCGGYPGNAHANPDVLLNDEAELEKFKNDSAVLEQLEKIKTANKKRLADFVKKQQGIVLDPNSMFDVQAKRLHEYKRQHMNALHILSDYLAIKADPNAEFAPKTYLFAAKAAPGYFMAKDIIKLINNLAVMIDGDPDVKGRLKVAYLEDYRVTLA